MDYLIAFHDYFYKTLGMGNAFYYALGFIAAIAILAQWRLYEKCRQPGIAAFIPVWNVIVFMRIVGRPASDAWKVLIPLYGQLYFIPKVWIEVVQCFGKRSMLDYVLVIALNGLYVMNLAFNESDQYLGPLRNATYLPPPTKLNKGGARPQLA
ncbi:MAG: DUF5684 domain-containing protein [Flavobacteriales bacterium]|nr:MAG: DUF5684 domain-containing protein [Flavobacteriales bacterium]